MAVPLKKLEDQLNCPICLDTYTNPKQLQCNHVYCQQCLFRLVVQDQQGQLSLTCPNCRQVTPVPASGVAGLMAAFRVNQLLEIVEEHKKVTVTSEMVESDSTSHSPHGNITVVCPEHGGKEVDLYCETCRETICWKCIMKGSKHHSHQYQELSKAFESYKEEITSLLEPIEKQVTIIKKVLEQLDTRCDELSYQEASIETGIHKTITRLHQTLDVRETELIGQLHKLTQTKLKSLAVQRDQLETSLAQLSSCLLLMKENLKTGNQAETLMMKSTTVRQVKELTTTFQPDMLKPNTEADMVFLSSADLRAKCQNYGIVYSVGIPDPSICCVRDNGVNTAAVGEMSTAILQTQPWEVPLTSISCELVSEIAGTRVRGSVERRGKSQYEISYKPSIKGRHQLHIKMEGQHIRGSPFPVSARSPMLNFGTPILTIDDVRGPCGVAVNKKRGGGCD